MNQWRFLEHLIPIPPKYNYRTEVLVLSSDIALPANTPIGVDGYLWCRGGGGWLANTPIEVLFAPPNTPIEVLFAPPKLAKRRLY